MYGSAPSQWYAPEHCDPSRTCDRARWSPVLRSTDKKGQSLVGRLARSLGACMLSYRCSKGRQSSHTDMSVLPDSLTFYSKMRVTYGVRWADSQPSSNSLACVPNWHSDFNPLALKLGLGRCLRDLNTTPEQAAYNYNFTAFIGEHGYTAAIGATQLSLLALYWRLFRYIDGARIVVIVLTVTVFIWILARVSCFCKTFPFACYLCFDINCMTNY